MTKGRSLGNDRGILPLSSHARHLSSLLDDPAVTLDRVAAAIEVGVDPKAPPEHTPLEVLDQLAGQRQLAGSPNSQDVMAHVFGALGFVPNTGRYHSVANSLLSRVLEQRAGIPLSLAVVTIAIGHRMGVELVPVGMPAHFLIGEAVEPGSAPTRWFDPFGGGRQLDVAGAKAIFDSLTPAASEFSAQMLGATPVPFVAARMLANIRNAASRAGDLATYTAASELLLGLPGVGVVECRLLARVLSSAGRHERAAEVYRWLAANDGPNAEAHAQQSARHAAFNN